MTKRLTLLFTITRTFERTSYIIVKNSLIVHNNNAIKFSVAKQTVYIIITLFKAKNCNESGQLSQEKTSKESNNHSGMISRH